MKITKHFLVVIAVALVFVLADAAATFAQDNDPNLRQVASGQKMKVQGIVIKRDDGSFRVQDIKTITTDVVLTPATKVRTHDYGLFRGGTSYEPSFILRGLRLQVEGVGNDEGQLVAKVVKFDERDLRMAQAIQATLNPVEDLAQSNEKRITAAEQNDVKMAGQIEENTALASAAQSNATRARVVADSALQSATVANTRISNLDTYETVKVFTVYFELGSAVLLPKAKATMDDAAVWAANQDTKGWRIEVLGYSDSTGNDAFNQRLSERRSNAVVGYLVTKHDLPLQRLVQPFGFGPEDPVADNATRAGRAKNRRVEIRVRVNKGITSPSG
ncbi:MAG TPA: OmpA family protein [Pyrinomonadaceae bacterium]|nr:OmpA family protein [Pyrinomonadaceae bacterium]